MMPSSLCLLRWQSHTVPMSTDYQEGEWPKTMKEDLEVLCHFSKWQQSTPMQTQHSLVEDAYLHLMQTDFACHFFNFVHYYSVSQFYLLILKYYLGLSLDKEKLKARENMGNIHQKTVNWNMIS